MFVQLSIIGVLSMADYCMVGVFCSHTKKGVLEYVCVHHKLMLWVLEGINGYVKCLCMLCHQVLSSVCNEISSYRWQSWGAEGNKR